MTPDDLTLLREFAASESEPAFAALVERHVGLVHSAALRQTGDAHLAEEITQAVFIILARKAATLGQHTILSAWLYRTTRYAASNALKIQRRRQVREQEAYMQSTVERGGDTLAPAETEQAWQQLAPLLDDTMGKLSERDRAAVVLRYFENRPWGEVAALMQVTEDAAQKRVTRALEKLRTLFAKRGVTLTGALIAGAVSAKSVQAAPVGMAKAVSVVAVAKGTVIPIKLTALVKGTMKTMTWLKIKFAVGASVAALLAAGIATVAVSQTNSAGKLSDAVIFQKARDAYAALTSYSDAGKTVATLNGATITTTFSIKLDRHDLYRIEWKQTTELVTGFKTTSETQAVWSDGTGNFLEMLGHKQNELTKEQALSSATGISGGAAATVPGTFFKMNWGNQLGDTVKNMKRQEDQKVGEVDCYVFSNDQKKGKRTLWIGKNDFLIHQTRVETSAETMKALMAEAVKRNPQIAGRLPEMKYTGTETHENIVVNQKYSISDFAR